MCKSFEIAIDIVNEYLKKGVPFTYDELCNSIINNGGVLRVYSSMTVSEYLRDLATIGILFYNVYSEHYDFIDNLYKFGNVQIAPEISILEGMDFKIVEQFVRRKKLQNITK
jgi:hypothetical protein